MRTLTTLLVGLAVGLVPAVASATPTFPGAIQSDLSLGYTPPCTICHQTNSGGTGTVVQAFGVAMKQHGLIDADTGSVQTALTAMESAMIDSDCDGTLDVDQLKQGRDPNTGEYIDGSGKTNTPGMGCSSSSGGMPVGPAYGCGAQVAPGSAGSMPWQAAAAFATAIALGLTRGRRRRA